MSRRGKLQMEQVRACPKAQIKFIKESVQSSKTSTNESFNLGITSQFHIVIESKESKDETLETMSRRIDCYLFEENAFFSYWCADTTVKNISLKSANHTTYHF